MLLALDWGDWIIALDLGLLAFFGKPVSPISGNLSETERPDAVSYRLMMAVEMLAL